MPVERAVQDAIPNGIDGWTPVSLTDSLRSDLRDLGLSDDTGDAKPYPLDASTVLGALYVLEGSSLGARVLVHRAAALGFSEKHGAKHLSVQNRDHSNWSRFVEILERHGELKADAVVRGANNAFAFALEAFAKGSNAS